MNRIEDSNSSTVEQRGPKKRLRYLSARARGLSRKAWSVALSVILVVGLSPLTKAAYATSDQDDLAQSGADVSAVQGDADVSTGQGEADDAASQGDPDAPVSQASGQLPSGMYWYNGDVDFTTIDSSNGFTSGKWDNYCDMGKDGSGNALGIAGSFHLVAFDTLNSSSHIYGNILANHVTNIQDYGVKPEFVSLYGHSALSYIQDYQAQNNRFGEQSLLNQAIVFGNNTDTFRLYADQNNGHETIKFKNTKVTGGSEVAFPRTVAQDLDTQSAPFIDMDQVKSQVTELSEQLASRSANGAEFDFSDQNKKTITYTKGEGCAYLDLPLSELSKDGNPIYIKGLPLDGSAALVINVDCNGAAAPIPDQVWLRTSNDQNASLGENDADTGYVLWNFTNASSVTAAGMVSSILAPGATINLKGNSCGTFIGDNINVSGETHTRPFHGKLDDDTPKPDTTSVSVSKQWLDSEGNAESASTVATHAGVQVQLLANGQPSGDAVTLDSSNAWRYAWSDLPAKDDDGNAIDYQVQEVSGPEGYTSVVSRNGNAFTVANTRKPEVDITATKVWNDNDDIDELRPTSVTATVMRSIEGGPLEPSGTTLTLSADNGWTATASGLPAQNADGQPYSYVLQEEAVSGYTGTVTLENGKPATDSRGNASYAFTLTNTHAASLINVKATKAWDDSDNQDGIRPDSVTAQLTRSDDGGKTIETVGTLELTAANGWEASMSGLPVRGENGTYVYSISEFDVPGYTGTLSTSADDSGNYTFSLTNRHAVDTTSVSVSKKWVDGADADGLRPDFVQVQLYADGQAMGDAVTLQAGSWSHMWTGLPKKANGKNISYTVAEVGTSTGYTSAVTPVGEGAFAITNTHGIEKTSVPVQKVWSDGDDQDGTRPDKVKVQLYRSLDGDQAMPVAGYYLTLDASNGWKDSFANLPVKVGGKAATYSVQEVDVPDGYQSSVTGNAADGFIITNTLEGGPEKTSVSVAKNWDDADNRDGLRPGSVTVQLYADGKAVGDAVTLSADNQWAYAWTGLDKTANGEKIEYSVAELNVPDGYTAKVTGSADAGFAITNTHAAQTTGIGVKKVWSDDGDRDALRPDSVTAHLLADGTEVASAQLGDANDWSATWANLPVLSNGEKIDYAVTEDAVEGYTSSVSGSADAGFIIVNTHAPAVTQVNVNKTWLDSEGNPQSGVHPAVTAQLYRTVAGETQALPGYTVTLDEGNGWAASWTDLPAKVGGVDAAYSVREADAPAGYTSTVKDNGGNSFTLVNTAEKRVSASVTKAWDDSDNADGLRPDSITARLCTVDAQGNTVPLTGKEARLSAANDWSYTWDDLAASDADGNQIVYTVQEANVPEGYEGAVSGGMVDGAYAFTLTNTHKLKTVDIDVSKVWNDQGNADGLRPAQVTAQLCYVNDEGQTVPVEGADEKTLDEGNGWAASWTGLKANAADGKAIKYTVREVDVPEGYTSSVSGIDNGDGTYSFVMTNTHNAEAAEFSLGGYSMQSVSDSVPAEKVCYVDPKVVKVLDGRALKDGEFTFQLVDKATGAVVSEASNDAVGMVDFDAANNQAAEGMEPCCLKFTSAGTYTYEVRESSSVKDPTVEYSNERIEFVATVADDADGGLSVTGMHYVHYRDANDTLGTAIPATEHPTITNKMKPLQLGLTKVDADTGAALKGATYGLYRAGESATDAPVLVTQATSDADGHMTFTDATASEHIALGVDYWFAEIAAPQGYARSGFETQHFKIEQVGEGSDAKYQLAYADGSKGQPHSVGTVLEYGDGDSPVADKPLAATIAKVDSSRAGLAGAKLGVRLADGTTPVDEWESNGAGHVLKGLKANTKYVLYEASAPDGFEKASDVTFTLDDFGKVQLADGAKSGDSVNAYVDGALNLVDYSHTEVVEHKRVQNEQGTTKTASASRAGTLMKTGDNVPIVAMAVCAVVALAVAGAALARRRKRR